MRMRERALVENACFAGAAEITHRPVTCERSWFNRCGTQITALMSGGFSF
jgi:hypothetical protein